MGPIRRRLSEQLHRVDVLRHRYERLAGEVKRSEGRADLYRLDSSIARRQNMVNHLNLRIDELSGERDILEAEILGCLNGAEALLADLVDKFESEIGPNWSPRPLAGYTAFTVEDDALSDGDHRWTSAKIDPVCPLERPLLPHIHGPCRERACGVIAWKSTGSLPDPTGSSMTVLAAVDLAGKIVEHEHGYRAAHGVIAAVLAIDGTNWLRTREAERIAEFCSSPGATFAKYASAIPSTAMLYVESDLYLSAARG